LFYFGVKNGIVGVSTGDWCGWGRKVGNFVWKKQEIETVAMVKDDGSKRN